MTTSARRIEVAVGILLNEDGSMLMTSRPGGKPFAGYWEFPGGKLEIGESVIDALRRELHEELGIDVDEVRKWKVTEHDYPHALVRLHWCKVFSWSGTLVMRERQHMSWETLPVHVAPVLPGAFPVLSWLAEEQGFTGATHLMMD